MLTFSVLAANAAIGILIFASGDQNLLASVILFMSFQIAGAFYAWLIWSRHPRPVAFVLFVFFCYGLAMPGLFQVRTNQFYWQSSAISSELAAQAAMLVFLSVVSCIIGYRLNFRRASITESKPDESRTPPGLAFATLLVSAGSLAFILIIFALFGPALFFGTRTEISNAASAVLGSGQFGLTRTLSQSLGICSLAIAAFVFFRTRLRNRQTFIALVLAICACSIANFPTSVARYWLVATLFVLMLTVFNRSYFRFRRAVVVATPIALFLIFPFLGSFNRRGDALNLDFFVVSPTDYMTAGDLDGFQSLMNVINLVDYQGISWGGRLLSVLFFFLPRSVWTGKYISTGGDAAMVANYSYFNISMPFPGEMYANFWFVGAIIALLLLGVLVRKLDQTFWNDNLPPSFQSIFAIVLAGFMPILFRGSLLGCFPSFAAAVFLIVVWHVAARSLPAIKIKLRSR